jgi:alpha-L-rhamnosidase
VRRRRARSGRRAFLRDLGISVAASVAAPRLARARGRAARRSGRLPPASPSPAAPPAAASAPRAVARDDWPQPEPGDAIDLSPARWLWLPSGRTLANTFVLFRKEIELEAAPKSARGWVTADSRYRLRVNGRRVQWGPAPCDPRLLEADPLDLTAHLRPGRNVIGAEVLFYGHGEGTWPAGKPGFILALRVEDVAGAVQEVRTDGSWRVCLDRGHRPGQFKRWYLRSLQEELDAREEPRDWSLPGFAPDDAWLAPLVVEGGADRPAAASRYDDYLTDGAIDPGETSLVAREVPLVRETARPALRLSRSGRVRWRRDPRDWFELRIPGSFELVDETAAFPSGEGEWRLQPPPGEGAFALFELTEQMVGFPFFTVEAPAGTVLEVMTQEAHDPQARPWLDTHFFSWSRFVCREGENRFETFDYESLRFLQIHVHEATGPVLLRDVGVRRRSYDWPRPPSFRCAEPELQRLFEAAFNTLVNAAQETIVDGMGRERQQYSGDGSHMLHATRLVCGDWELARRFQRTWALGQTHEGWFFDCWPAWDRLNRIGQREMGATPWGPLLDHGVSFIHDVWRHHEETGDRYLARELYPRLARFARFLLDHRDEQRLLPVEGWGVPTVWLDNPPCFPRQRHKQCAFNLFTAAILRGALVPLAELAGEARDARRFRTSADALLAATVRRFWDAGSGLFVSNLPWQKEEGGRRLDDRSLATALLFGQCPAGRTSEAVGALAEPPAELGLSYPANAHWRLQALARHGRIDVVLRELRHRWAAMPSVLLNNTISERWEVRPDSRDQWSHCAVAPLFVLVMDVAGIRPGRPGFERIVVRPQLGDLGALDLVAYTPPGPVGFQSRPEDEGHRVSITLPADCEGELRLPAEAPCDLARRGLVRSLGLARYALPAGEMTTLLVPR